MQEQVKNIFSVDVEDWFHILGLSDRADFAHWSALESRVERGFETLLKIFDERQVKATCFFLGWVAEKFPQLVRRAVAEGHEIASHGYSHQLVTAQTPDEFFEDIRKSRLLLEDISGSAVLGYRAPGFSITKDTPWALDQISSAGFQYDSSLFPGSHGHGGVAGIPMHPFKLETSSGVLTEFPISHAPFLGRNVCFFGGGYLRLFPYSLIRKMTNRVNLEGRPVIFYIHPREVDVKHPRLPMNFLRSFKCYVNLSSTEEKVRKIVDEFSLIPFREWIFQNRHTIQTISHQFEWRRTG